MAIKFVRTSRTVPLAELRSMSVPEWRELAKNHAKYPPKKCTNCEQDMWIFYRRAFNAGMAKFLMGLVENTMHGEWIHFKDVGFTSRDYNFLAWWGLAETRLEEESEDKKYSGFWRATPLGVDFALDHNVQIPSHLFHVSGMGKEKAIIGWESSRITILQVNKFSFQELMLGGSLPKLSSAYRRREKRHESGASHLDRGADRSGEEQHHEGAVRKAWTPPVPRTRR